VKGWVHIFDEESLGIVLRELSTAPDFVHYLNAKIALFDGGQFQFADSEADLMGGFVTLTKNRSILALSRIAKALILHEPSFGPLG
jgi:hypothetical protein